MKVYCLLTGVELLKQSKQLVSIIGNEKLSADVDIEKLAKGNSYFWKSVLPGMEGSKFKLTINTKGYEIAEWLNIAFETIKGLQTARKDQKNPVK
jgi:transcription-repair coupling factor (superfamily II helicase)